MNLLELKRTEIIDLNTIGITYTGTMTGTEFTTTMSNICEETGDIIAYYLTNDVKCDNQYLRELIEQTIKDGDENSFLYLELRDTFDSNQAAESTIAKSIGVNYV